jgi:hypothetical protein
MDVKNRPMTFPPSRMRQKSGGKTWMLILCPSSLVIKASRCVSLGGTWASLPRLSESSTCPNELIFAANIGSFKKPDPSEYQGVSSRLHKTSEALTDRSPSLILCSNSVLLFA